MDVLSEIITQNYILFYLIFFNWHLRGFGGVWLRIFHLLLDYTFFFIINYCMQRKAHSLTTVPA